MARAVVLAMLVLALGFGLVWFAQELVPEVVYARAEVLRGL